MENINIVYCICLENRKSHMIKFFHKMNIKNVLYINPILGINIKKKYDVYDLINENYIIENHNLYKNKEFNYNKLANTLTFINLLKQFLLTGLDNCIIFEDDLKIPTDNELFIINNRIKLLFNKINDDWQYINLGRCWDRSCIKKKNYKDSYFEIDHCSPVCTHAIILKKSIAKYLIENTLPLKYPKDNTWRNIIHLDKKWSRYAYCTIPAIFYQDRDTHESTLKLNSKNPNECNGVTKYISKFKYKNPFNYNILMNKIISTLFIILLFKLFQTFY